MSCNLKKRLTHLSAVGLLTFASTAFFQTNASAGTIVLPPGFDTLSEYLNHLRPPVVETPTARFETVAIEISNTALTAGSTVPAGTPLKLVNLATSHNNRLWLQTGNAVTYSIDGEIIATEVPEHHIIRLQTNVGRIAGIGFSLGENAYLLIDLNTPIEGVSNVVADSTAFPGTITSINEIEKGFIPLNTEPAFGQIFVEAYNGSDFQGASVASMVLYDADGLRGTAENITEELLITDLQGQTTNRPLRRLRVEREMEGEADVLFNDGSSSNILVTRFTANFNYGRNTRTYLFNTEALTAYGKTIEDIAQVTSFTPVDHDLSWAQLGFSGTERNNNPNENTNENRAPVAQNDRYTVQINRGIDVTVDQGVLANDADATDDVLTARLTSQTSNGILTFLNDGAFSYIPDPGFTGEDSFTYSVSDGEASSGATVTIDVQDNTFPVHIGNVKTTTKTLSRERWRANARITVLDENGAAVPDARVNARVNSNGTTIGIRSCITNTRGICRLSATRLSKDTASVVFTVWGISSESTTKAYQLDELTNNHLVTTTVLRPE